LLTYKCTFPEEGGEPIEVSLNWGSHEGAARIAAARFYEECVKQGDHFNTILIDVEALVNGAIVKKEFEVEVDFQIVFNATERDSK
jgi:hypothetical protein